MNRRARFNGQPTLTLPQVKNTPNVSLQDENYNFCVNSGMGFNQVGFATPAAYCKVWAYNPGALRPTTKPITEMVAASTLPIPYSAVQSVNQQNRARLRMR